LYITRCVPSGYGRQWVLYEYSRSYKSRLERVEVTSEN
jgi:hypothetical protein